MFRLVCVVLVVAAATAQKSARYVSDPREAAILSEQRYLSGDGTFGAAYTQEDGVDFKEESDAAGNRRGSYSYVDPSGQRRTISYTAGKNGFVATGDHLPVAPAGPAAPAAPAPAPVARYNPAPQYNTAPQQFSAASGRDDPNDGQYYPELYERESNTLGGAQYQAPAQPQYQPAPQPQYQPAPQPQYSGVQQQQPRYTAPVVQQAQYQAPAQPQYSGVSAPRAAAPQPQYAQTTQSPNRFFPPGKLDLNRSPDGYSYSFSSQV